MKIFLFCFYKIWFEPMFFYGFFCDFERLYNYLNIISMCIYCTKLEPISKIADVPRAERVVALN